MMKMKVINIYINKIFLYKIIRVSFKYFLINQFTSINIRYIFIILLNYLFFIGYII